MAARSDEGMVNFVLGLLVAVFCLVGALWLAGQISSALFLGAWPNASLADFDVGYLLRHPGDPGGAWPATAATRPQTLPFYVTLVVLLVLMAIGFGALMMVLAPGRFRRREQARSAPPPPPPRDGAPRRRWFDFGRADEVAGGGDERLLGGVGVTTGAGQGWFSPQQKADAVLRVLGGEPIDSVAASLRVDKLQVGTWVEQYRDAGLDAMKSLASTPEEERLRELQHRLGELEMENQLLRARVRDRGVDLEPT